MVRDWRVVETLLDLTLASLRAQTDGDWRAIVACHDTPSLRLRDPRVRLIEVDWDPGEPGPHNADSGRKKHFINDLVLGSGGGYLMLLDADDWIDAGLVRQARAHIGEDEVGGVIERGFIVNARSLRVAPAPGPCVDLAFHRVCGSSTVALLRPDDRDVLRRDPFSALRSHHQWIEVAATHGVRLARLPATGAYLIDTGENHSERHGPHAAWFKSLARCVDRHGTLLDEPAAARFGLVARDVRRRLAPLLGKPARQAL